MAERELGIEEFLAADSFTLREGVLFVQGANRGAVYDLNTGRVYSLNRRACEVLTGKTEDIVFWNRLSEMGLATTEIPEKKGVLPEMIPKPSLQFVWFEIVSDDCNQKCIHCYANSMPPFHRKAAESVASNSKGRRLSAQNWRNQIEAVYFMGCRQGQFIGGEPFKYRGEDGEDVLDLAEHAINVGYDFVEIFTNATLLTRKKVERIKNLGLHIAVSLYSHNQEVHDQITNLPGSFRRTVRSLEILKEFEVPTRVETIITRLNEQDIEEALDFVEKLGFAHKSPDVLRSEGRGADSEILPSKETAARYGFMTAPNFRVDKGTLLRYVSGHSCLMGKIVITDCGDILPCIFSRNIKLGNVLDDSLTKILDRPELNAIWASTKDDVLVCQDCEYRYVCFDCRRSSFEEMGTQDLTKYLSAPYPRCTYNPYTGEWAVGVSGG